MMSLIVALASGGFALLGVLVNQHLTNRKEQRAQDRAQGREHYQQVETIYTEMLVCFEKADRLVKGGESLASLIDELARVNARLRLYATADVRQKAEAASDALSAWASEHVHGLPERMGNGLVMVSSTQTPHQKKARELRPAFVAALNATVDAMKVHLNEIADHRRYQLERENPEHLTVPAPQPALPPAAKNLLEAGDVQRGSNRSS